MNDASLQKLAQLAGLETSWMDFRGLPTSVSMETLRALLRAMGLPSSSTADLKEAGYLLAEAEEAEQVPKVLVGRAGQSLSLPAPNGPAVLRLEDGTRHDTSILDGAIRLPSVPGYHDLSLGDGHVTLAVAPPTCWQMHDAVGPRRVWSISAQVYSLRGGDTDAFGDFRALARFAEHAAQVGAQAVAISPVHALFAADPQRYGPYAPSTRLFLNGLYGDTSSYIAADTTCQADSLIDWPAASALKWQRLRTAFAVFRAEAGARRDDFQRFVAEGGESLLAHARFEVLDARFRAQGVDGWQNWTGGYADAASPNVHAIRPDDPEVAFHLFVQWLADCSMAKAQLQARGAGMNIGLIADLAVGMDGAGSHAWSRPGDILTGVGIGAPPDLLGPDGQNWGLTTFSPRALRHAGYAPFLATLRAAMRNAGGIRLDHVMGLRRLWVVPDGAGAGEGAYLNYPMEDLLNLIALESTRHRAIVIGEDLGTVPEGFRERIAAFGILSMRVLWFERTARGGFLAPERYPANAAAMTTTHDLPTIAGWWKGHDIDLRAGIDRNTARAKAGHRERRIDRRRLQAALARHEGSGGEPRPLVDAAIDYIAATPSPLAIIPVEDMLGKVEQPNLPGTTDEHPNWRQRLPPGDIFERSDFARRAARLTRVRGST